MSSYSALKLFGFSIFESVEDLKKRTNIWNDEVYRKAFLDSENTDQMLSTWWMYCGFLHTKVLENASNIEQKYRDARRTKRQRFLFSIFLILAANAYFYTTPGHTSELNIMNMVVAPLVMLFYWFNNFCLKEYTTNFQAVLLKEFSMAVSMCHDNIMSDSELRNHYLSLSKDAHDKLPLKLVLEELGSAFLRGAGYDMKSKLEIMTNFRYFNQQLTSQYNVNNDIAKNLKAMFVHNGHSSIKETET